MLERRTLGEIPPKPHTVFKPKGHKEPATEYVLTRDGFAGGFSLLYLQEAPTAIVEVNKVKFDAARLVGDFTPPGELPLARRHVQSWQAPEGKDLLDARTALMRSTTCKVSTVRGQVGGGDWVFNNGDADELYFVYEGSGELVSTYGRLPFGKSDYVLIPRGTPYFFDIKGSAEMLLVEGDPHIEIPAEFRNPFGQLKLEAPYTHRDFRSPRELLSKKDSERFRKTITLRNGALTEHVYDRPPAQIIGWDGSVYPIAFNIYDYLPKTGKIHLPPNMHLTFKSPKFVICSFVPRMVDYLEGAIPCPYPHSNVHCDEIIYYVSGNFTSRKGVKERSISHHPMGVPHGPQPGKYLASVGSKSTDEVAVMVDLWEPLSYSKFALKYEDPKYALSWSE